jgi:hypothetical protein
MLDAVTSDLLKIRKGLVTSQTNLGLEFLKTLGQELGADNVERKIIE